MHIAICALRDNVSEELLKKAPDLRVDQHPAPHETLVQPRIAFVEDAEILEAMAIYHPEEDAFERQAQSCSFLVDEYETQSQGRR
jgi:hypothetical protein